MHIFGWKGTKMRRSDRQIEDKIEIDSIIRSSTICHLALSEGDQPYVVPLNFGYEEGALYFHCAKEGRKIDIIRRNPRVCFSFVGDHRVVPSETPCGWTMRYREHDGEGEWILTRGRRPEVGGQ